MGKVLLESRGSSLISAGGGAGGGGGEMLNH